MIGASIIAVFMLLMGMFVVPNASAGFNESLPIFTISSMKKISSM